MLKSFFVKLVIMITTANSDVSFQKNAKSYFRVGYSKVGNRQKFTEMSVSYKPLKMLKIDKKENIDYDNLKLEMKTNNGCWVEVDGDPIKRGRNELLWRLQIQPCEFQDVRLALHKETCVEYLYKNKTLGPQSIEVLKMSGYRPDPPTNLRIKSIQGKSDVSVSVSWTPSHCTQWYDLYYQALDRSDDGNMTLSSRMTKDVTIFDLNNCTDYSMRVVAMLGMEISEQIEAEFNTCDTENNDDYSIDADYIIADVNYCVEKMENRTECTVPKPNHLESGSEYIKMNSSFVLALTFIVNLLNLLLFF